MKNLSFLFLISVLALGSASCGKKSESGSSNRGFSSNPYQVSTVEGFLDIQQPIAYVGNISYQISPQTQQVAVQAMQVSYQQGIQPVNGRLRARLTGSVGVAQGQFPQQYPQQQGVGSTLNLTQVVIYR